jgi:hypothetical protein
VELKKSDFEPTKIEFANGSHVFQFNDIIVFNEVDYEICTQYWMKKAEARNEAAFLTLCAIAGKEPQYTKYNPAINPPLSQEKTVYPTTSIESEELVFRKPGSIQHESMEVSHDTGELLTDYITRKAKKDAFSMLKLLSTRLDSVSGASWTCDVSPDVLAIINLQLGNEKYFSIGMGPSKTKARKAAGEKLLEEIDVIEWVEKHYPNETI